MVTGKTKSGIRFTLDERIKNDVRLLYLLNSLESDEVKNNVNEAADLIINFLKLVFGSGEKLREFMDAVAWAHDGVCSIENLFSEMKEMFEALDVKNS